MRTYARLFLSCRGTKRVVPIVPFFDDQPAGKIRRIEVDKVLNDMVSFPDHSRNHPVQIRYHSTSICKAFMTIACFGDCSAMS